MVLCVAALALYPAPLFNDGWVGYTGSPKLLGRHPSVRMVSERITATIRKETAIVDCHFVFRNDGAATAVRMGFPDEDGNREPGEQSEGASKWFKSYVDGRRVPTTLLPKVMPSGQEPRSFQVKTVSFGRGQTRTVRDTYEVPLVDLALGGKAPAYPAIYGFTYMFSTGSTWKGAIGRTEMTITFAPDAILPKGKIRLMAYPGEKKSEDYQFRIKHRGAIQTENPFKVSGRTLRLVKTNWSPGVNDDVWLTFGPHFRKM